MTYFKIINVELAILFDELVTQYIHRTVINLLNN